MNPFNDLNPYNSQLTIPPPGPQPPGAPPRIPPYSPEEEQSILSRIGGGALRGLGWLGGSLSKAFGGRALRGLIGGHPEELASVIPFSDSLGITDPANEVRGSDLLGGDQDTSLLSPQGAGGLALDVLLDPATYLTFGGSALTEAGLAAKKAHSLAPTFAGRVAAGQHGLMGIGLPFHAPATVLGAGQGGSDLLNAVGSVASRIPGAGRVAQVGRDLGALFDPTLHGATSTEGQIAARQMEQAVKGRAVQARELQRQAGQVLQDGSNPNAFDALRGYIETGSKFAGDVPGVQEAAGLLQPALARQLEERASLGIPGAQALNDPAAVGYFPRHMGPLDKETSGYVGRSQQLPTGDARLGAREDILKGFPDVTGGVNALTGDQALYDELKAAPNMLGPAAKIRGTYLGGLEGDDELMYKLAAQKEAAKDAADKANMLASAGQQSTAPAVDALTQEQAAKLAELEGRYKQSLGLADFTKGLDPAIVKRGGMFNQNPLEDFMQSSMAHARVASGTEATMDMLARGAKTAGQIQGDAVPLVDVLAKAGLGEAGAATAGAKTQMIDRLTKLGLIQKPEELMNLYVPGSLAKDATKLVNAYTTPEGMESFKRLWDSVTNLTKAGQTSLWPAFHARNFATGLWQNYVTNAFDPRFGALDPRRYLAPFQDAWAMRKGGAVLEGASTIPIFKGMKLTDAEATQKIYELAHDHGVLGRTNLFSEVIGGEAGEKALRLPGQAAVGLKEKLAGSTYNPLDIAGVGGIAGAGKSNVTKFAPAVAGQHIGEAVDETNRLSAFVAKLRQGFEPGAASAESKLAHFDYSALTPFERTYARRVIPFYNWMSNNIPFSVRQLAEQPGGKLGMALKASGEAQGRQGGFLPDAVASGLALPLGGNAEEGTKRYLTHMGLPFEDMANYASGSDWLGSLNPLIKGPLELATGRQLHTGRKLEDLYSMTGSPLADQALANSPASRFVSTFRTAIDERKTLPDKALNMLSGMHLADVDMDKAKSIALRDFLQQALAGNPHFRESTNLSVRPDALAELSPQEIQLLRLQATMNQQSRQRARIGVQAR